MNQTTAYQQQQSAEALLKLQAHIARFHRREVRREFIIRVSKWVGFAVVVIGGIVLLGWINAQIAN